MRLLRDHRDELGALVAATADALGIDAAFVEKDYWVVEVLRAATVPIQVTAKDGSRHPVRTIFKGGTSLGRVYGLIERFSEDVDLLVSFPQLDIGIGSRDRVLKSIRDAVSAALGAEPIPGPATTGVKRYVRYPYPARYGSHEVTEGVLLEMGSRGGDFPMQQHELRSMIANHAVGVLGEADDTWDEFGAVPVEVLAPERTLLEKLALLHDGASRYPYQAARTKLRNGGRHLYDVHRLLGSADVIAALSALGSVGVADLCSDIDQHSEHADFSFTPRPAVGYGGSPLVDPAWLGRDDLRQGYAAAMNLVYGERPSFDRCLDTVRTNAALL